MRKSVRQRGSVHVLITIAIMVLIIGGLAYVFWHNASKPRDETSNETTQSVAGTATMTSTVGDQSLTLTYPDDWEKQSDVVVDGADVTTTTLTSPDQSVIVQLDQFKKLYYDGTCPSTDKLIYYEVQDVTEIESLKVVSAVMEWPQNGKEGDDDYAPKSYAFLAGIYRQDALKDIGVGRSYCPAYVGDYFDATYMLPRPDEKAVARLSISLPKLYETSGGAQLFKSDVDGQDMQAALTTDTFKQAVKILQSLKG